MPRYALSRAAEDDLAEIAAYTVETFGIERSIAYRDGLIRTFEFLSENPASGMGARIGWAGLPSPDRFRREAA
jgi:toxin ParE1/3/4